ncbi:MAG TPA: 1-deoxy-D-xylulose-5-phosphate reductoisomerase [bacterium]|nr:1-deoxy-D-xylulose-5-phosphate reductoisomerase [bacterium]
MKKIAILGATGSIGVNALNVVRIFKNKFKIVALSGYNNLKLLDEQIAEFHPECVAVASQTAANNLKKKYPNINFFYNKDALVKLAKYADYDILIVSVVGAIGLLPVIEGIKKSKRVAIANKEPLVIAGKFIMELAKKCNSEILPIDSEHSAIFQCLKNEPKKTVNNILLTASGGPFFNSDIDFKVVKPADALAHPNWSMGAKITIDSATMMNKGLEVIEARWLFDVNPKNIKVIIHPQSIIHSMVEFKDGSIIAQLGTADMKIPIQYALTYPERFTNNFKKLDLIQRNCLNFYKPDMKKFRCLALAYSAIKTGGAAPAILNAANEIAVNAFLNNRITFDKISIIVESALNNVKNINVYNIKTVLKIDKITKKYAESLIKKI